MGLASNVVELAEECDSMAWQRYEWLELAIRGLGKTFTFAGVCPPSSSSYVDALLASRQTAIKTKHSMAC